MGIYPAMVSCPKHCCPCALTTEKAMADVVITTSEFGKRGVGAGKGKNRGKVPTINVFQEASINIIYCSSQKAESLKCFKS